jgi:NAD(P)-dependent dehydrogenase (short-subunit alcohol dehydrogenase family)
MADPLFDVAGKVIVVTGALGQLGHDFCRELLARGARVAAVGRESRSERIKDVLGDLGDDDNLRYATIDITDKESITTGLDEILTGWGAPDGLVNNAGIDTQPSSPPEVSGPFEEFPEEVFREVVEVNLTGTFLMIQAVGSRMRSAGKGGSIVNVGSIYGMLSPVQDIYAYKAELTGVPFIKPVAYSASKSGVYNLTRYCATYWGRNGIRVNTLTPSGIGRETQDDQFRANYTARIPIGRMATTSDYLGPLVYLLADGSTYMTGANLVVDGGWTAW